MKSLEEWLPPPLLISNGRIQKPAYRLRRLTISIVVLETLLPLID